MTGAYTKLITAVDTGERTELDSLARRWTTTAKLLAELAVRQMFVAARAGPLPEMPPLDPERSCHVSVWLQQQDRAALDELAADRNMTPENLTSLAVRYSLMQARGGALPMLKPPKPPEPEKEPASAHGARANFIKARLVIDRLHLIAEWGLTDRSRAHLKEAEELFEAAPY